jgi:predicted choloylglycine hydrolase
MKRSPAHALKPATPRSFPFLALSVSSYFELGYALGQASAAALRASLRDRAAWFKDLKTFAEARPRERLDPFLAAAEKHFPRYVEELRGLAQGAGLPFRDLFILNLNPELSAIRRDPTPAAYDCSSLLYCRRGRILLAHNEDGANANRGRLLLLRAKLPSGLTILGLVYPGILPGNAPGLNSAGLIHTCNYIATSSWRPGIPRYFLDRAALEARSLEEAVARVTHPARAYAQNHNLVSLREARAVGVEVSPENFAVAEVDGVYAHANHLVQPDLRAAPQPEPYLAGSRPRQEVLEQKAARLLAHKTVRGEDLVRILRSHQGRPNSPCRHPSWNPGSTLASALFAAGALRLCKGNPCRGQFTDFIFPAIT